MSKCRGARWAITLVCCLVLPAWPSVAHASQESAKRYFRNGVDLITAPQPNYQDAYYQFQLAYQESAQSWKVLGNLGLCALKLERDQEAATYYELYLERGGSDIAVEERNAIEQDLLLLKGNLATVRISSSVTDLKVIDHRAGSSAPAQPYTLDAGRLELRLRAGNHSISATRGDKQLTWDIVLEPKAVAQHVFDFDAPAAAPPAAVSAPTASPLAAATPTTGGDRAPQASSGLRTSGYVALAAGAVGLGLGGYFLWQGADFKSQSDAAFGCNRLASGCTPAQRAVVRNLEGDSEGAKTRGAVALGVGGAAVATGVVLLLLAPSTPQVHAAGARIEPWLGYRAAGLSGSF